MASAGSFKDHDSITVIPEGGGGSSGHNNPSMYDRISHSSLEKGDGAALGMAQGEHINIIY